MNTIKDFFGPSFSYTMMSEVEYIRALEKKSRPSSMYNTGTEECAARIKEVNDLCQSELKELNNAAPKSVRGKMIAATVVTVATALMAPWTLAISVPCLLGGAYFAKKASDKFDALMEASSERVLAAMKKYEDQVIADNQKAMDGVNERQGTTEA